MMESKELALKIARLLDDKKGLDITVIDVAQRASFTDYFVLVSAGTDRQAQALMDNVEDMLESAGVLPKNIEGKRSGGWILMDYGDVVVNIMTTKMREKYNLEKIWGDCESLQINQ